MTEKLISPCIAYQCRFGKSNKNKYTCMKCEARTMYIQAISGDPEALAYLKKLSPEKIGIEIIPPPEKKDKLPAKEYYEEKYFEQAAEAAKKLYGIDFASLNDIIHYMCEHMKVRKWIAKELGIPERTFLYMKKIFKFPDAKRGEGVHLSIERKKKEKA